MRRIGEEYACEFVYVVTGKLGEYAFDARKYKPSLRMAMISTMKGGKSNFHMRESNIKSSCQNRVKRKYVKGKL